MNAIRIKRYLSPVGELLVGSFDGKLCISRESACGRPKC